MDYAIIKSPVGHLILRASERGLIGVEFTTEAEKISDNIILIETTKQLREYFALERTTFDLPLELHGSAFQRQVWDALRTIPYGATATYGEIGSKLGNKNYMRAVGGANNKNPISIIIPCHRVVNSSGLGGYGGGVEKKEWLLAHEKRKTIG